MYDSCVTAMVKPRCRVFRCQDVDFGGRLDDIKLATCNLHDHHLERKPERRTCIESQQSMG